MNGETDNPRIKKPYNNFLSFGCLNSIRAITNELQKVIINSNTTDTTHTSNVFAYNLGKSRVSSACLKLSRLNDAGKANGLDIISELVLNESKTIQRNGNTTIAVINAITIYMAVFFFFGIILIAPFPCEY